MQVRIRKRIKARHIETYSRLVCSLNVFCTDQRDSIDRTGETMVFPDSGSATYIHGNGFFWYDTYQNHIMTNTEFRNCGYRSNQFNQYDTSHHAVAGTATATDAAVIRRLFDF